jgi:hypothetical protein
LCFRPVEVDMTKSSGAANRAVDGGGAADSDHRRRELAMRSCRIPGRAPRIECSALSKIVACIV